MHTIVWRRLVSASVIIANVAQTCVGGGVLFVSRQSDREPPTQEKKAPIGLQKEVTVWRSNRTMIEQLSSQLVQIPHVKMNLLNPRSLVTNCSFEFENDTLKAIVRITVRDDGMTFHLVKVLVLETSQVCPVEPLDPQGNYIDEIQGIVSDSNLLTYEVQTSLGLAER